MVNKFLRQVLGTVEGYKAEILAFRLGALFAEELFPSSDQWLAICCSASVWPGKTADVLAFYPYFYYLWWGYIRLCHSNLVLLLVRHYYRPGLPRRNRLYSCLQKRRTNFAIGPRENRLRAQLHQAQRQEVLIQHRKKIQREKLHQCERWRDMRENERLSSEWGRYYR